MPNLKLLEDPEEMRQTASAVETLKEEFQRLSTDLQTAITEVLKEACAGEVADEFSKYYNENIHTQLVAEGKRLENVVLTIRTTARAFEDTSQAVRNSF